MGKSLMVRRANEWDRCKNQYVQGKEIAIIEREFEYDTTYTNLYKITPDEARYLATELWRIAEQIDGKTKKTSVLKKIRSNTQKIAQQAKKEAME